MLDTGRTGGHCLSRRDGGKGASRQLVSRHPADRNLSRLVARQVRDGDGASSALLRAPDDETPRTETRQFIEDLRRVAEVLGS